MQQKILHILERSMTRISERSGSSDYPFIDTKFDIVTDRDFDETDEPFRRKNCIYSWIQGRGLESLAKHVLFFQSHGETERAEKLQKILSAVMFSMEKLREKNGGYLPFAMPPDGHSFFQQGEHYANFSDLFYSKGLVYSAHLLGKVELYQKGKVLFQEVLTAIDNQEFRTDQQSFDPKNPVEFVPGKFPQGPRMIALGGLADLMELEPENPLWSEYAERFIRFIVTYHINTGEYPDLQKFDFIESLDNNRKAWTDGSVVFSDPGHALEFIGLAGKCLLAMRKNGVQGKLIDELQEILPELFCHIFDYGFNHKSGGICKGFDLKSRKSINSDMPWWNLPETVRAGMELMVLYPSHALTDSVRLKSQQAFDAFFNGFLQENGFGCQTRSEDGSVINVIPAVSDADPGYHTNLSLIDVFMLSHQ